MNKRKTTKRQLNQELINRLAETLALSLDSFTEADIEYEALSVMVNCEDIKEIYKSAGWAYIPTRGAKQKHESKMIGKIENNY